HDSAADVTVALAKLSGEAGRPGRGGYALRDTLRWPAADYKKLQNRINVLAEQHLDLTTSFTKQSANRVKTVYKHATREFPDLGKYKDCWPVKDYLIQHLQYTSRKS
ncbi:hypothetical protein OE88DRAFT_1612785, partial [Heliocybe sulcata]